MGKWGASLGAGLARNNEAIHGDPCVHTTHLLNAVRAKKLDQRTTTTCVSFNQNPVQFPKYGWSHSSHTFTRQNSISQRNWGKNNVIIYWMLTLIWTTRKAILFMLSCVVYYISYMICSYISCHPRKRFTIMMHSYTETLLLKWCRDGREDKTDIILMPALYFQCRSVHHSFFRVEHKMYMSISRQLLTKMSTHRPFIRRLLGDTMLST